MKRTWGLGAAVIVAACSTGCVEQRYVIYSDPPGAMVYRNGDPIGYTPVDDTFVYYGKYHFTLVKDGYETLQVDQDIPAPWYEFPGAGLRDRGALPVQPARRASLLLPVA